MLMLSTSVTLREPSMNVHKRSGPKNSDSMMSAISIP